MKYVDKIEAERNEHLARHQSAVQHLEGEAKRCQQRLQELQQEIPTAIGDSALAGQDFETWRRLHEERDRLMAFIHDSESVLVALRTQLDTREFEGQIRVAREHYRRMDEHQETIKSKMAEARKSSVGVVHVSRYVSRLRDVAARIEESEACEQFLESVGWIGEEEMA